MLFIDSLGLWLFGLNLPLLSSIAESGRERLWRPRQLRAGAAISSRVVKTGKEDEKSMRATFRRLAVATVLARGGATVVLPATEEARWGWRGGVGGWGWGGF